MTTIKRRILQIVRTRPFLGLRFSKLMALTVGAFIWVTSAASFSYAAAPKMCIPLARGVPGLHGAPNWWGPFSNNEEERLAESFSLRFLRTDDPRWRSALDIDYSHGGPANAEFRALYNRINNEDFLYLSWSVKGIFFKTDELALVFGLKAPSGPEWVFKVQVNEETSFDATTMEVEPRLNDAAYMSLETHVHDVTGWAQVDPPTWIKEKACVWIMGPEATGDPNALPAFTVQARIPMGASGLGLNPGEDTFYMWYTMQPSFEIQNGGSATVYFTWPRPDDPMAPAQYGYTSPTAIDFSTWGEFGLGNQTGCAGVTLQEIKVTNDQFPNSNTKISLAQPNTFHAFPKNATDQTLNMRDIKATFYFANWGSQVGDLTSSSWEPLAELVRIPVVDPDPSETNPDIAPDANNVDPGKLVQNLKELQDLPLEEACKFYVQGAPNEYLIESVTGNLNYCDGQPPPHRNPHSCVLVKLEGGGLEYMNDSLVRNMDFAEASLFERDASISVAGLPPDPRGSHTVYLMVDRRNMGALNQEIQRQLEEIIKNLKRGKMPDLGFERLTAIMPTYVIHAFRDTGKTVYIDNRPSTVLSQMTSFGYLGWHEGTVLQWITLLAGVQKVEGTGLYKVSVPNNGSATIKTSLEAVQPGMFRQCFDWFHGK